MHPESQSVVNLERLSLLPGQGETLDVPVEPGDIELGGHSYAADPPEASARLDVSRTLSGYALRLRIGLELTGPCMRCLESADLRIEIDAREVDQPEDPSVAVDEDDESEGGELTSPYVDEGLLDVGKWARDAMVLTMPDPILCRTECPGLCDVCGERMDRGSHDHGQSIDPRWEKLRDLGGAAE